ncbi:RNA 2',3'-cyclic phosphodiesterase [Paenibacillus sp. IHBB 10380]|uniref:RNA 2',3'-cyclic phosphodiesterase n=1 Tax=Paenibacillus sp. IHBB 10380 TaxID=1566358 RepID=UPI00069900EE|nr:RNA 2',3'-cyclic phosphodiesterase [Paenibacillus sp. IHBB 10380]
MSSGNLLPDSQRLFVALKVPEPIGYTLQNECKQYKIGIPFTKWTYSEDYHITLQFLGDTESNRIPALCEVLNNVASEVKPFKLEMGTWDTFGVPEAPRVLYRTVAGNTTRLECLQQKIVESTVELQFNKEARKYRPHITVARKYTGKTPFQRDLLISSSVETLSWCVSEFVLFTTHIGSKPMYEVVEAFPIKV